MAFLISQRRFIKLYILHILEQRQTYGLEMMEQLKAYLKEEGYSPPSSELYRGLHELVSEGIIASIPTLKRDHNGGDEDFQEVVLYRYTTEGKEKASVFRQEMKMEIDRCLGMLRLAVKENFK